MVVCQWILGSSDMGLFDVFDESLMVYMIVCMVLDVQVLQLGFKIGVIFLYE